MSLERFDRSEPARPEPVTRLAGSHEERRDARVRPVAVGTLSCPRCDAPVAPGAPVHPADPLLCPYCGLGEPVRDFLSLAAPTRPARVEVRVVRRQPPGG